MNTPSTCKILVLSANPRGTNRLRLDEEMREIVKLETATRLRAR